MPNSPLPVSSRPETVMFPKSGEVWTAAQRNAIWGGDVGAALVDLVHGYRQVRQWGDDSPDHHSTPKTNRVRNGVTNGT